MVETPLRRELNARQDWQGLRYIRRLIAEIQPDVLHLHCAKAGFLGRLAAIGSGVRSVFYSPHCYAFDQLAISERKRKLYWALEKSAAWLPGITVCCSQDELEIARTLTRHAVLVENSADFAAIDAALAGVSRTPDEPVTVATLCRLSVVKGPDLFAQTAAEVQRRCSRPVRFLWIGGGDESLMPADAPVELTGWLPRDQALETLVRRADVYLQTSHTEGQPIGVIEALGLGLPSVVTDVTGSRSTVRHDVTGFVADLDPHALADKVLALVENDKLRGEMGTAARVEARSRFSVTRAVDELEQLYRGPVRASGTSSLRSA